MQGEAGEHAFLVGHVGKVSNCLNGRQCSCVASLDSLPLSTAAQHSSADEYSAHAGMVLLVFCNGLLDAWLLLSKRSPIHIDKHA